jgi:hypothetical protein
VENIDYEALHQRLAQAIVEAADSISRDTQKFTDHFIVQLAAAGYHVSPEAQAALTQYVDDIVAAVRATIARSVAIGYGKQATPSVLQSPWVLAATEDAFSARWPDGLTLSDKLWNWRKSALEGVHEQLRAGIATGDAASKVIYAMQRAIERDAGTRFEMVSNNSTQWVRSLQRAARGMIHKPADRQVWNKTVADAQKYINKLAETGSRSASERLLSQIQQAVKTGQEGLVDNAVKWWLYDRQLYDLKRIVRTEAATAAHRAVIDATLADDSIIGYQWLLSPSHAVPDICDYYANIDMGLGQGVWTKEAVPRHKAHPHCMCALQPRVRRIKQAGSQNYVEFIQRASPDLREQLLPEWVKAALKDGMLLDQFVRPDGLGLVTKTAATESINTHVASDIVAKLAQKATPAAQLQRFQLKQSYI